MLCTGQHITAKTDGRATAEPWIYSFRSLSAAGKFILGSVVIPTLQGTIQLNLNQTASLINITLVIPLGSTAHVCLPPPTATSSTIDGVRIAAQHETLTIDGQKIAGVLDGRMLCVPKNLSSGEHAVARAVRSV